MWKYDEEPNFSVNAIKVYQMLFRKTNGIPEKCGQSNQTIYKKNLSVYCILTISIKF